MTDSAFIAVSFPLALLCALLVSMTVIPLMMRLAPRLGMVDMPDARKVHARPVPRVGGIGIVVGALASVLLWMPAMSWLPWFLFGCVVLLFFGAWDDRSEIGHYPKFAGQLIAVVALVYGGDLWVRHLPFLNEPLDPALGRAFTVFALVGMINAINHSDGLDGLAGGESLMSLGCMAYLGYLAGATEFLVVIGAVIGGLFGFLRYNAHPARVFMGDAGSQFLGFALGALAVSLTQNVNPGLSMALPALILGLPIVDILSVFAQRVRGGMNWFRATKNHVHHRLLALGFAHPQAVLIIYAVQAMLVASALLLRYESDALVASMYGAVCALVFGALWWAERTHWSPRPGAGAASSALTDSGRVWPRNLLPFIWCVLLCYFVFGGLLAREVSDDIGLGGVFGAALAAIGLLLSWRRQSVSMLLRLGVFSVAALLVYTLEHQGGFPGQWSHLPLVMLAAAAAVSIRFSPDNAFRTTPLDYLMILLVIVSGLLAQHHVKGFDMSAIIVQLVVLFYSFELIAAREERGMGTRLVGAGACCAGVLLATRALL